ncbi:hypothetical protein C8F01DRAFT_1181117 [Mycena amicta]|nr:hypothetical protein C8F01DRAFT_1181117 [Mycena amicta]
MILSTPFAARLGSNYCPTDDEAVEIKALIAESSSQLPLLDAQIATVQKSLDTLYQKRSGIAKFLEAHKDLVSPIRRLPVDVIQEIFIACLPTQRNCVMSASEAPVLLGRVCSFWRTLSLSTPRLWSSLHLVEPVFSPSKSIGALEERKFDQRIEVAKAWLGRSGQCPLSISFLSSSMLRGAFTDHPSSFSSGPFIDAIMEFAPRWEDIYITAGNLAVERLEALQEADVPMLRSFRLSYNALDSPHMHNWANLRLLHGPRLTHFFGAAGEFRPDELPLRWGQLTHLAVDTLPFMLDSSLTSLVTLQALQRCPMLQLAKLMVDDGPTSEQEELPSSAPLVELPLLHTLEVTCTSSVPSLFRQCLARVLLPGLRNFALLGHCRYQAQQVDYTSQIVEFFARTPCLEKFHLKIDGSMTEGELLGLLGSLPATLRQLFIRDTSALVFPIGGEPRHTSHLVDDVFVSFVDNPSIVCPALQELIIQRCVGLSESLIGRFVAARMAEPSPSLRLVRIKFDREQEEDGGEVDVIPYYLDAYPTLVVEIEHRPDVPPLLSPWQGLLKEEMRELLMGWTLEDWQF